MGRRVQLSISGRSCPAASPFMGADEFLRDVAATNRKTAGTYRSGLRLFADWLQHFELGMYTPLATWPLPAAGLTTELVISFRNWVHTHRSPGTANTYTMGVYSFLVWLEGAGRAPAGVDLGRLSRQLKRTRKKSSASRSLVALDVARQRIPDIVSWYMAQELPQRDSYGRRLTVLRDRALVQVLYSTAARIHEVASISRDQVDQGQDQILIIGKGSKARTIHLDEPARAAIAAYLAERADTAKPLFISHSRNSFGKRLSIVSIETVVKTAVRELGLDDGLSAHDFRHYRATQLLRSGVPIEVVQEYLGHADIATTRNIYAPLLGAVVVSDWLTKIGR